jgi:uncharacterized membrane protein
MPLFNEEEEQQIKTAIENAERRTSGEIRICIEKNCSEDVLDRSADYFLELDMHKTKLRNGVLIYLATVDRKFAIIGDVGINKVVPDDFWDKTKEAMLDKFKHGNLIEGIITGINMAGEQLKKYFPYDNETDLNELPDHVAYMSGN